MSLSISKFYPLYFENELGRNSSRPKSDVTISWVFQVSELIMLTVPFKSEQINLQPFLSSCEIALRNAAIHQQQFVTVLDESCHAKNLANLSTLIILELSKTFKI